MLCSSLHATTSAPLGGQDDEACGCSSAVQSPAKLPTCWCLASWLRQWIGWEVCSVLNGMEDMAEMEEGEQTEGVNNCKGFWGERYTLKSNLVSCNLDGGVFIQGMMVAFAPNHQQEVRAQPRNLPVPFSSWLNLATAGSCLSLATTLLN